MTKLYEWCKILLQNNNFLKKFLSGPIRKVIIKSEILGTSKSFSILEVHPASKLRDLCPNCDATCAYDLYLSGNISITIYIYYQILGPGPWSSSRYYSDTKWQFMNGQKFDFMISCGCVTSKHICSNVIKWFVLPFINATIFVYGMFLFQCQIQFISSKSF